MSNDRFRPDQRRPSHLVFGIALALSVVVTIIGASVVLSLNPALVETGSGLALFGGLALGMAVATAFVAWLVMVLLYLRRPGSSRGYGYLAILAAASLTASLAPFTLAAGMFFGNQAALSEPGFGSTRADLRLAPPPRAIADAVEAYHQEAERERAAFEVSRRDVMGAGIVQVHELDDASGIAMARERLAGLRQTTEQAFVRQTELLDGLEADIRRDVREPGAQKRALKWLERQRATRTRRLGDLQTRLVQVYDDSEAMLDILERARGQWHVRGNRIGFENEADLIAFNRHDASLEQLTFEIDRIEAEFERDAYRDEE